MKMALIILGSIIILVPSAFAAGGLDGSKLPACHGVTDVCMAANVTAKNSQTGKVVRGYQPALHSVDGKGLWGDCVSKLANGVAVPGVTGVSAKSAQMCLAALKAARGK